MPPHTTTTQIPSPTDLPGRLLWFKRRLPKYATKFIEMCVVLCADHGPCVSGGLSSLPSRLASRPPSTHGTSPKSPPVLVVLSS